MTDKTTPQSATLLSPATVVATPVDTSGYSKLATELKAIFDKMYVAIKKGKAFRLGADEVHNLMLRISALGEEAEAEIKLGAKDAKAFVEKLVNPPQANKKLKEILTKETNENVISETKGPSTPASSEDSPPASIPAAK